MGNFLVPKSNITVIRIEFFDVSTISAVACQGPGTHIYLVETAVEITQIRC